MNELVVTRHPGLVEYLEELGVVDAPKVVSHATPEQVRDQHVFGVLPLELAAEAWAVTVVPLRLPPELRGKELSKEQVAEHAGELRTFSVEEIGA